MQHCRSCKATPLCSPCPDTSDDVVNGAAISIGTRNEEAIEVRCTTTLCSGELPHCPPGTPSGCFPINDHEVCKSFTHTSASPTGHAPGVMIDGAPLSYGRLSERKLRRALAQRATAGM